jgi:hypothetical protein
MTAPSSPTQEEREIVAWLRKGVGMEAGRMILMSGLPGGTRTQRVKDRAFAEGCAHAVTCILKAIESGEWRTQHQGGSND